MGRRRLANLKPSRSPYFPQENHLLMLMLMLMMTLLLHCQRAWYWLMREMDSRDYQPFVLGYSEIKWHQPNSHCENHLHQRLFMETHDIWSRARTENIVLYFSLKRMPIFFQRSSNVWKYLLNDDRCSTSVQMCSISFDNPFTIRACCSNLKRNKNIYIAQKN